MQDIIKVQPNEDKEAYRIRLYRNQQIYGLSNVEVGRLCNEALGTKYDESTHRKYARPYIKGYEAGKLENLNSANKKEQKGLEQAKIELQKERYKLQTEKLEFNKWVREHAREELYIEKIINAIKSSKTNCYKINDIPLTEGNKEYGLFIADCHFDKDFKIYGLNNQVINEYSPEIFYKRMEYLLSKTIRFIHKENVNQLKVFNLGDSLDGFLRHSQIWTLRHGVVDSAIIFGKYMAEWLGKLSRYVNVEYHPTCGNHGELRILDGKKGEHINNNIEKIVSEIISIKNENNPNFKLINNKTGYIYTKVAGYNLLGIHGEVKDASQALKDFSDIFDEKIDIIVSGHKHHTNIVNCGYRKHAIGIGSIVGSDDFSLKIRKQADATANIITFEAGKGKVNDCTIVLN